MAIAVDSNNSGSSGSAGTTISWSHTCTGANLMLIVQAITGNNPPSSVTYNGVSMTMAVSQLRNGQYASLWYLSGPSTGANTVEITKDNGVPAAGGSISFSGASPSIGASNGANGSSTVASVTVTTTGVTGYVVDCVQGNTSGSFTKSAGQTQIFNITDFGGGTGDGAAGYLAYSAGSDPSMSYTLPSAQWSIVGVEVTEFTGGNSNLLMMGV